MKIRPLSDLHLEFSDYEFNLLPTDDEKNTTLTLAGDIGVGVKAIPLLKKWCKRFKHVIYVAGNHEFYGGCWEVRIANLRKECKPIKNLHFLEKESVEIDGVSFFGATFWTPGSKSEYIDWYAGKFMNDFKTIKRENKTTGRVTNMNTDSYKYYFDETIVEYNKWIDNGFEGKRVVISHHAPSIRSSLSSFRHDELTPFYCFEAEEHCKDLHRVCLWQHGHMHNMSDYNLECGVRVVCNPRGYYGEAVNQSFINWLEIEV